MKNPIIIGKNSPPIGKYPAICLTNPKFKANVGAIQRAASCFNEDRGWIDYDESRNFLGSKNGVAFL